MNANQGTGVRALLSLESGPDGRSSLPRPTLVDGEMREFGEAEGSVNSEIRLVAASLGRLTREQAFTPWFARNSST